MSAVPSIPQARPRTAADGTNAPATPSTAPITSPTAATMRKRSSLIWRSSDRRLMVVAVVWCLTAVDDGDGIDREQEAPRQLHEWRGSDRRRNREELPEQRVEHRERVGIRDEARDFDDAGEAAAGVLENRPQIRECPTRLRFEGVAGDVPGRGIDSGLARGVDEVPEANGSRVGADPGNARAVDDFRW